jgi:hypothetical protein
MLPGSGPSDLFFREENGLIVGEMSFQQHGQDEAATSQVRISPWGDVGGRTRKDCPSCGHPMRRGRDRGIVYLTAAGRPVVLGGPA